MLLVDWKTLYKNLYIGSYEIYERELHSDPMSTPGHGTDDGSFIIFFSLIIIFWVSRWCKISMKISVKKVASNET